MTLRRRNSAVRRRVCLSTAWIFLCFAATPATASNGLPDRSRSEHGFADATFMEVSPDGCISTALQISAADSISLRPDPVQSSSVVSLSFQKYDSCAGVVLESWGAFEAL